MSQTAEKAATGRMVARVPAATGADTAARTCSRVSSVCVLIFILVSPCLSVYVFLRLYLTISQPKQTVLQAPLLLLPRH